ncbi:protein scribble homolog [Punica granatum]|uniref:Protein scribble homolog n=1 Tax=Punica granatum TaxID=22663 RepID=A0A6P8C7S4_PUNGR|nr:protein scribble homolog [Punica granatum]
MRKLETLFGRGCKNLTQLPDSTSCFTPLEDLVLDCSSITKLPDSIGSLAELSDSNGPLSSLTELNLSNMTIRSLPDSVGNLSSLEILNIDSSLVEQFPVTLWMLEKLKLTNASKYTGRSFKFREIIGIKAVCIHLENLVVLDLSQSSVCEDWNAWSSIKMPDLKHEELLATQGVVARAVGFFDKTDLASHRSYSYRSTSYLNRLPNVSNLKKKLKLHVSDIPMLREIEGLGNLVSMKVLDTRGCPLTNLRGLERLESLRGLRVRSCIVERLLDLLNSKHLRYIDTLDSRQTIVIQDLDSCEKLCKLEGLEELHGNWFRVKLKSNNKFRAQNIIGPAVQLMAMWGPIKVDLKVNLSISFFFPGPEKERKESFNPH